MLNPPGCRFNGEPLRTNIQKLRGRGGKSHVATMMMTGNNKQGAHPVFSSAFHYNGQLTSFMGGWRPSTRNCENDTLVWKSRATEIYSRIANREADGYIIIRFVQQQKKGLFFCVCSFLSFCTLLRRQGGTTLGRKDRGLNRLTLLTAVCNNDRDWNDR